MKLKCKKIRGVEKSICTAEQKIAYNYAFANYINYDDEYKACTTEMTKSEILMQIRDCAIKDMTRREDMKKYNIDAVFVALNNGLKPYFDKFFIASDYSLIGEIFKVPYDII